jgi:glutamate-1-semialdehyde 2,1-aminomutase
MPVGNTRSGVCHDPHLTYLEDGDGCYVTDVDGNEYLDFVNNMTPLIQDHDART